MVLLQIVGAPLLFDLFIVHSGDGVATLTAYSAYLVRTFLDMIHLFLAFSSGSDERFPQD